MEDIKLKDFSGETDRYDNVPKVWLESAESTEENRILLPFTYGEAVSADVEPDFSTGNMAVDIPEGRLISELTIRKPPALTPGNIREGVNIAGVVGKLTGGGNSGGISTQMISSGTVEILGNPVISTGAPGTHSTSKFKWTINVDGNWKTTVNNVVLHEDQKYVYECGMTGAATAMKYTKLGNYGECILVGSKMLVEGGDQYGLNVNAPFAMIYRPGLGTTTIIIDKTSMAIPYADSDEVYDPGRNLIVWEKSESQTISFAHGKSTKPDAVFLFTTNYSKTINGVSTSLPFGQFKTAAWGLKSSLGTITSDDSVAGYVSGSYGYKTTEMALDVDSSHNDRRFYLYCPDETTVRVEGDFVPGAVLRWFAIWGISEQS